MLLNLIIASDSSEEWPVPVSASLVQEWRDRDGQVRAFGYAQGRRGWLEWPGLATFAFSEGSIEVVATPRHGVRQHVVEDVFRQNALPLILQALGWEALHASAVLTRFGVVGLCGSSEEGTSAIAYGLSQLGYRRCADGALVLDLRGSVRVESLPFLPRLMPSGSTPPRLLPELLVHHNQITPDTNPAELLSALVLLSCSEGSTPQLTRLSPTDAFPALLKHAYCFNPVDTESKERFVANYLSLVSQVPVFRLELGEHLRLLDRVTRLILDAVNGAVLVREPR